MVTSNDIVMKETKYVAVGKNPYTRENQRIEFTVVHTEQQNPSKLARHWIINHLDMSCDWHYERV